MTNQRYLVAIIAIAAGTALVLCAALTSSAELCCIDPAENPNVPHERTFPGLKNAGFPYVKPEDLGLENADFETLATMVTGWVKEDQIVGAECLIVKEGKIVFHEAFGWRDVEEKLALRRNSIYRVRSMTKPFVGTAILQLQEAGRLILDDPVAKHLKSWDNPSSGEITIRQLLQHVGGFQQGAWPQPLSTYSNLRAAVDAVGAAGPKKTPGEQYEYSDLGSATLGAIVAEISGVPVEDYLKDHILKPLGLANTHCHFVPDVSWADRMCSTYNLSADSSSYLRYWHPRQEQAMPFFRACGGLYSTPLDYARFLQCWMNSGTLGETQILSKKSVEEALTPGPFGEYGMQWFVLAQTSNGVPFRFGHTGSDSTYAWAYPKQDVIVVFFTQSRGSRLGDDFTLNAMQALGIPADD